MAVLTAQKTYRNERNWRANLTVLSGEIGDPGIRERQRLPRGHHGLHLPETAGHSFTILDGFTITAGYANGWGADQDKGGGFFNNYGNPDPGQFELYR